MLLTIHGSSTSQYMKGSYLQHCCPTTLFFSPGWKVRVQVAFTGLALSPVTAIPTGWLNLRTKSCWNTRSYQVIVQFTSGDLLAQKKLKGPQFQFAYIFWNLKKHDPVVGNGDTLEMVSQISSHLIKGVAVETWFLSPPLKIKIANDIICELNPWKGAAAVTWQATDSCLATPPITELRSTNYAVQFISVKWIVFFLGPSL